MVISAPTGSGKTVIFELCILRLLSRFISSEGKFIHVKGTLKTIYIAPSKALVQEKLRDWNQKFGPWGVNCLELTGDNESYNLRNIHEADIILTTPEKFDAVSRYGIKDGGLSFFSDIALLLIDEVHLLNDARGAALEAIVSRIKIVSQNPKMKLNPLGQVRYLAVSATIPNVEDVASWLNVPDQGIKRFGEEMRPVKLTTRVFGYAPAKNDFLFEKRLQNYIFDILMQYSRGKAALIFCSTRKGAQEAAQRISQIAMSFGYSNPFIKNKEQQDRLREASLSCSDKQMQSCILFGVGYHNGGLCLKDRNLIEGLFLKGDIQVLCATNTLAHGINLPAHTVVIKSTQHFNKEKGLYMEYDRSTILQMCGRAGRPPFDDTGMVIIMTRRETVHLYENLLNGCEMVESQLLSCVTEHLTAEIVQLTVSDITKAIEWMKCSYLYVRMRRNPENYAVKKGISGDRLEKHVQEICVKKVNELSQHRLIWVDEDGFLLRPLEPGRFMTKYYLRFDTMKQIMRTPENCNLEDALHVICRADEIAWIQLRRNEKKILNDINADKDGRLRFHILADKGKKKKRIQTREEKIFILANDCLTGDPAVHDLSLIQALYSMGIKTFEALAEADSRRIEIVTGRKYPFGNHIKDSLLSLPLTVDIKFVEVESQRHGKSQLVATLTRISQSVQSDKRHYANMIIGSEEDNSILFHEKIRVDQFSSPYTATIFVTIPQEGKQTIKADFIYEEYIGIDIHQKVLLNKENNSNIHLRRKRKQPSSFPPAEEVHIIDDDDMVAPQIPIKGPSSLKKPKNEMASIPNFNLLDEELREGGLAPEFEDDECKIITEKTVFDHIREKAKNFSIPSASNCTHSPSPEVLLLTRKHAREKRPELYQEVVVLDEIDRLKIPQHTEVNMHAELNDAGQNDIDSYLASKHPGLAGSSSNFNNMVTTGVNCPKPEASTHETSTEETVFDHIRRKSKNFPLISKFDCMELFSPTKESFSENHPDSLNTAFDKATETNSSDIARDNLLSPYMETTSVEKHASASNNNREMKHENFEGFNSMSRVLHLPEGVSRTDPVLSSIYTGTSIVPMSNNKKGSPDLGLFTEVSREHHRSRSESKEDKSMQCCSLETAGKTREVDSFLGFKSVFSFL
ncbi:hypothetical protein L6164_029909 [Bauhinia variegata]|uniref:Uncharacterized protein n=1 Tax=Bauhinia variegata TaxID=167791 RepID=A0ACB9LAA2_BAUVA|nr:hypothetical protein L6164_029909 [Bauhinia variegata]